MDRENKMTKEDFLEAVGSIWDFLNKQKTTDVEIYCNGRYDPVLSMNPVHESGKEGWYRYDDPGMPDITDEELFLMDMRIRKKDDQE